MVALAALIQYALWPAIGPKAYPFLYPAIFLGSLFGRFWPGVAATVLATLSAAFLFVPQRYTWGIERSAEYLGLAVFFATGVVANWLGHRTRVLLAQEREHEMRRLREETLARKRIEESEERLKFALKSAQMGAWTIDLRTFRADVSDEVLQILGIPAMDAGVFDMIQRLVHPDDREEVARGLNETLGRDEPYHQEFRLIRPDGRTVWILSKGKVQLSEGGEPVTLSGIIMDITARKEAEARIHEAVRARDEFISIASHELRTPLTSLLLQTQIMERGIAKNDAAVYSPERVNRLVEHTARQLDRIRHLVDDMLDVARIQARHLILNPSRIGLRQIIQDVVERISPDSASREPLFILDCPEEIEGDWDAFRIEQVVTNLLTNAIKYGGGKPVRIRLARLGAVCRMSVADEGEGVAAGDQERIFNRFERASSPSSPQGLGLGLYISREIVRRHHGRIWVESPGRGRGATFHVELPI